MPHLSLVYSRTRPAAGLCLSSRKAASIAETTNLFANKVIARPCSSTAMLGQLVTWQVSLCAPRRFWLNYFRQDVGRYLPSSVLGVHDHRMLPLRVLGDSTSKALRMAWLALGPLKATVIAPPVTSTLET